MDMEWMRSLMTVAAFATFIGIVLWAWSSRKKGDFEVAARSVLDDDETELRTRNSMKTKGGGHE
ncbi:MAG: cbb3-type cytochrome c oxidase subunit 3 [Burkholderiales bacterium]